MHLNRFFFTDEATFFTTDLILDEKKRQWHILFFSSNWNSTLNIINTKLIGKINFLKSTLIMFSLIFTRNVKKKLYFYLNHPCIRLLDRALLRGSPNGYLLVRRHLLLTRYSKDFRSWPERRQKKNSESIQSLCNRKWQWRQDETIISQKN